MKIKLIKLLLMNLLISNSFFIISAQSNQQSPILVNGWDRYLIPNNLQIDIPPTMEIQSGKFRKMADSYYRALDMSSPNFVFQQKGLNNREQTASEKYARIILSVNEYISDKVIDVNSDIKSISTNRLNQIDTEIKTTLSESYSQNNVKLVQWNGVKLIKINNMSCVSYSHVRQLGNRPEVFVLNYSFERNNTRYILTLSYRLDKEQIYKKDFQTVINSLLLL
jgi:hypothetical protein